MYKLLFASLVLLLLSGCVVDSYSVRTDTSVRRVYRHEYHVEYSQPIYYRHSYYPTYYYRHYYMHPWHAPARHIVVKRRHH